MAEAAHVDEGSSAPLLEKVTIAAYWDGCPGCAVERRKAASPGVPYGNFLYVWIVTLSTVPVCFNMEECNGGCVCWITERSTSSSGSGQLMPLLELVGSSEFGYSNSERYSTMNPSHREQ